MRTICRGTDSERRGDPLKDRAEVSDSVTSACSPFRSTVMTHPCLAVPTPALGPEEELSQVFNNQSGFPEAFAQTFG